MIQGLIVLCTGKCVHVFFFYTCVQTISSFIFSPLYQFPEVNGFLSRHKEIGLESKLHIPGCFSSSVFILILQSLNPSYKNPSELSVGYWEQFLSAILHSKIPRLNLLSEH